MKTLHSIFHRRRLIAAVALLAITAAALSGCYTEKHVIFSSWDTLPGRTQPGAAGTDRSSNNNLLKYAQDPQRHMTWTVQVASFAGPNRADQARALITQLTEKDGLDNVWLQGRQGVARVFCGQFSSPSDDDAQQALAKLHAIAHGDQHPYARAQLISLDTTGKVYANPYNLKSYHDDYTLQIGFYNGPNRRQDAESAVESLRARGVQAYYYHGPMHSLVTVGLFTQQQAFTTRRDKISPGEVYVQGYSDAVHALQKRFPYNLGNGKTIDEYVHGKNVGAQPSSLVKVP